MYSKDKFFFVFSIFLGSRARADGLKKRGITKMEHFINVKTKHIDRILKDFVFKNNIKINKNFEYIKRIKLEYYDEEYETTFEYKYRINAIIKKLIPDDLIHDLITFTNNAKIRLKEQRVEFTVQPRNNDYYVINGIVEFCRFSDKDSVCKLNFRIDFKNKFLMDSKVKEYMFSLIKKEIEDGIHILSEEN